MAALRSVQRHGRMICFDDGADRFQLRAVGIAMREDRLLIHRATYEQQWSLPGGRVEQGEASPETLVREMQEELLVDVEPGPLLFVIESFFSFDGRAFQELGLYHGMIVPERFPFAADGTVCHRVMDGDAALEFKWVRPDAETLGEVGLLPPVLRDRLGELPRSTVHLVEHENSR